MVDRMNSRQFKVKDGGYDSEKQFDKKVILV